MIQNEPVGCLFVAISGEKENIRNGLKYLQDADVQIKFIKGRENIFKMEAV